MRTRSISSSGPTMDVDSVVAPLTAAAASRALAAGRVSASALVDASLARIAAHDQRLNSFVLVLADEARRAARAADRARKAGRARGPLHGIPFGLKDIYETASIRTTAHSRLLLDHVPKRDSTVARKLAAAGAILIGKLATHEFAIRGPAGYCGIAGFKPTYGVVSRSGVIPLANSLDHCGPMGWTVEDCALLLDAIAGPDPADPAGADRPYKSVRRGLSGGIAGMRIGVIRHFFERDIASDPQAVAAIEAALKVLRKLGA